jgi:hypothetical protein
VLITPGAARWFWVSLNTKYSLLLFLLLLVPRLPAIRDLRQELADVFDFLVPPYPSAHAADLRDGRNRNLVLADVTVQRGEAYPQLLRGLSRRIRFHFDKRLY